MAKAKVVVKGPLLFIMLIETLLQKNISLSSI